MREIMFQGYDAENKCWRYGWYTRLQEGARKYDAIVCDEDGTLVRYYIHDAKTIRPVKPVYTQAELDEAVKATRQEERERCARICDEIAEEYKYGGYFGLEKVSRILAEEIRKRGEK